MFVGVNRQYFSSLLISLGSGDTWGHGKVSQVELTTSEPLEASSQSSRPTVALGVPWTLSAQQWWVYCELPLA